MHLTPKQQCLLAFIESYREKKGYAPAQAEIAKHFGFSSLGTVQNYLKALEAKGFLSRQKHLSRSLQLNDLPTSAVRIPLSGQIMAGKPIEAIEQNEMLDIPSSLLNGGLNFALKVQGDSMIEEGIHHEDLVVIRKQNSAENGQIVVALVNNEATLKKFYKRKNGIELHPANAAMKPIIIESETPFQILGIVVGLIRKYKI